MEKRKGVLSEEGGFSSLMVGPPAGLSTPGTREMFNTHLGGERKRKKKSNEFCHWVHRGKRFAGGREGKKFGTEKRGKTSRRKTLLASGGMTESNTWSLEDWTRGYNGG